MHPRRLGTYAVVLLDGEEPSRSVHYIKVKAECVWELMRNISQLFEGCNHVSSMMLRIQVGTKIVKS